MEAAPSTAIITVTPDGLGSIGTDPQAVSIGTSVGIEPGDGLQKGLSAPHIGIVAMTASGPGPA